MRKREIISFAVKINYVINQKDSPFTENKLVKSRAIEDEHLAMKRDNDIPA
jgi:hypothetical protein